MEAMLFALDLINNDTELLAGLKIGYDARDTCVSENIGLDEALDLIIIGSQLDILSCQTSPGFGMNDSALADPPTTGIIGAANSGVSVPVAGLGRPLQIPQICWTVLDAAVCYKSIEFYCYESAGLYWMQQSATKSSKRSNYSSSSAVCDRYEYFYQTIPPDDQQVRAMIDVLLKFNWMYVSAIHTVNAYGEGGIKEFRRLAAKHNIYIEFNRGIRDDFDDSDFDELVSSLIESLPDVIVNFVDEKGARCLLSRIANSTAATWFT